MEVKTSITLNKKNISILKKAIIDALPQTMDALKTEVMTMQVVPKETGALEESATTWTDSTTGHIGYNTPYARRLYYNPQYNFRTDKNANAKGRWLDDFVYGKKKEWLTETYGKFMVEKAKGVIKT